MIKVIYRYTPKHNKNDIVTSNEFNSWQKALRFMKLVDGPRFAGHVLSYECDDPYDTEMLWRRHKLTPDLPPIED